MPDKKERVAVVLAACLGLAACVSARPVTLPSGAQGQIISCNGMARSIADCYEKAGAVCPAGYAVVNAAGEANPMAFASGTTLVSGVSVQRSLMVECR